MFRRTYINVKHCSSEDFPVTHLIERNPLTSVPVARVRSGQLKPLAVSWSFLDVDLPTIIVSVITSGVASTIIGFWLNAGKSRKEFLRDKLEQLFVAERLFSNLIATYIWLPYMLFLTGKRPFPDPKYVENAPEGASRSRETFEMLAMLYFPEFLPAWIELTNALKEFNRVVLSINREDGTGHQARQSASDLDDSMKVIQRKQKAVEQALILRARQLMPRSWWHRLTCRTPPVVSTLEES